MKKKQVKHLEDEFSSLFHSQQSQPTPNGTNNNYQSDLQQASQPVNSGTFKEVPQGESESSQDFLDQLDDILDNGQQNEQLTRREIMLNFKTNELKLLCKNLKMANIKLAERIQELERPHSQIADNSIQINRSQDLTLMQQQFTDIQQELGRYKQQLAQYQEQMASQINLKHQQISKIRNQLNEYKSVKQLLEKQIKQKNKIINFLEHRNEDLLLTIDQIQNMQEQQDLNISRAQGGDFNFNERITSQMEVMIDKLMNQLKYEKRNSSRQLVEIKRLNNQVIALQNKMKEKNNKIYQLQLTVIKMNKQEPYNLSKERSPTKFEHKNKDQTLACYLPQQNYVTKSKDSNKHAKQKNLTTVSPDRISAQREQGSNGKSGANYDSLLPLNKFFSTFTIMDLLNREFKIRASQKYIIACRVIDLYANKLQQGDYSNLISQEIEIYNYSSHAPKQLKVRVNALNRGEGYETNEESMLYNMSFILDTLLNQVQVLDASLGARLQLNFSNHIDVVLSKQSREEKYHILFQLANNIERQYLNA